MALFNSNYVFMQKMRFLGHGLNNQQVTVFKRLKRNFKFWVTALIINKLSDFISFSILPL